MTRTEFAEIARNVGSDPAQDQHDREYAAGHG